MKEGARVVMIGLLQSIQSSRNGSKLFEEIAKDSVVPEGSISLKGVDVLEGADVRREIFMDQVLKGMVVTPHRLKPERLRVGTLVIGS